VVGAFTAEETNAESRCQMLTAYGLIALLCIVLLVLSFSMVHAPEKTTSEMIREIR
jgi:hypothetical protein